MDEQPKQDADKGKSKVEEEIPCTKEMVITKPVDETIGSSQVFSMTQWRTQMKEQIREIEQAYNDEVSLKQSAAKSYEELSDQIQDKLIDLVEKETMINQLQIAFQAETTESES